MKWSLLHGDDPYDPLSYIPLCKQCHTAYDQTNHKGVPRPSIQGRKHPLAKLTEDDVREVRSRPVVWGSFTAWAKEFGVGRDVIRRAANGETYRAA
jgi:hypothetical protein